MRLFDSDVRVFGMVVILPRAATPNNSHGVTTCVLSYLSRVPLLTVETMLSVERFQDLASSYQAVYSS